MTLGDEIKKSLKNSDYGLRLVLVNIVVFIIVLFSEKLMIWLSMPSMPDSLIAQPWSPLTYMFVHYDFIHLAFNMIILYVFSKLFVMRLSEKQLLSVYIYGGLTGAGLHLALMNLMAEPSLLLGASAAVMAVVLATAVYTPDFRIHLLFIGPVKLKYVAIFTVLMDLLGVLMSMTDSPHRLMANNVAHFAHLGGALYGYLFIRQLRKGHDLSKGFIKLWNWLTALFQRETKMKVVHRQGCTHKKPPRDDKAYNKVKKANQEEIDRILDKISKSGYESLSKREKDILFKMGN